VGEPRDRKQQNGPATEASGNADRTADLKSIRSRIGRPRREPKLNLLGSPDGIQPREKNGRHDATFTTAQRASRSWRRPAQNDMHQGQ
jgi:hypothetical protein